MLINIPKDVTWLSKKPLVYQSVYTETKRKIGKLYANATFCSSHLYCSGYCAFAGFVAVDTEGYQVESSCSNCWIINIFAERKQKVQLYARHVCDDIAQRWRLWLCSGEKRKVRVFWEPNPSTHRQWLLHQDFREVFGSSRHDKWGTQARRVENWEFFGTPPGPQVALCQDQAWECWEWKHGKKYHGFRAQRHSIKQLTNFYKKQCINQITSFCAGGFVNWYLLFVVVVRSYFRGNAANIPKLDMIYHAHHGLFSATTQPSAVMAEKQTHGWWFWSKN